MSIVLSGGAAVLLTELLMSEVWDAFVTFLLLEITLDSLLPLIFREKIGKEQQFSSPLMSSSPLSSSSVRSSQSFRECSSGWGGICHPDIPVSFPPFFLTGSFPVQGW